MNAVPRTAAPPAKPPLASAFPSKTGRLERLKSEPRKPGEASFFWFDAQFQTEAVKVLPGEYFVYAEDLLIMTTLGSCIACCLWDSRSKVGGLNHFLLPDAEGPEGDSGRYGSFAMELLINEMMKRGASRNSLEAKVFGGGQVIAGMESINVGERNTRFVLDYLRTERIPVVSKDVMDVYARKVCFLPASGKALVKRLAPTNANVLVAREKAAAQRIAPTQSAGGSIDLF